MIQLVKSWQMVAALVTADDLKIPKANGGNDAGLISGVLNPIYFWAGVVAVIVITVAGFMYVVSAGDPAKVSRSKNAIVGACVGLILTLGAFVITNFVIGAVK